MSQPVARSVDRAAVTSIRRISLLSSPGMREYIRSHAPGGTFFLTLVTHHRAPILTLGDHVQRLRRAMFDTMRRHPFTIQAAVILPDHLHLLVELPKDDSDFSTRVSRIKARFTPDGSAAPTRPVLQSFSRTRRREREVWQRRFWEHTIRDRNDFEAHADYIHYNPVKHGLVPCPHAWPYSSFHRHVRSGCYTQDWACSCIRPAPPPPSITRAERTCGE